MKKRLDNLRIRRSLKRLSLKLLRRPGMHKMIPAPREAKAAGTLKREEESWPSDLMR